MYYNIYVGTVCTLFLLEHAGTEAKGLLLENPTCSNEWTHLGDECRSKLSRAAFPREVSYTSHEPRIYSNYFQVVSIERSNCFCNKCLVLCFKMMGTMKGTSSQYIKISSHTEKSEKQLKDLKRSDLWDDKLCCEIAKVIDALFDRVWPAWRHESHSSHWARGEQFLLNWFKLQKRKMIVPISGWWFQIVFIFTPTWGNDPIWRAYFSHWNHQPASTSQKLKTMTIKCAHASLHWISSFRIAHLQYGRLSIYGWFLLVVELWPSSMLAPLMIV